MSGPGTQAFEHWWTLRRTTDFPQEPPVTAIDDIPPTSPSIEASYGGRQGGFAVFHLRPQDIPGQAMVDHEMGHDIAFDISDRLKIDGAERAWVEELFTLRGAPLPSAAIPGTLDATAAAREQAFSMLPEAFLGELGPYKHPLYDNINDPVGAVQKVRDYFASPLADQVRWFFRNYKNWQPASVVTSIAPPSQIPQPAAFQIEWLGNVPNTNYNLGRGGNPIVLVVDHWTVASLDSAVARFQQYGTQVSAHYIVGQTGRIVQMVKEEDTAYHAGNYDVNLRSIGIEHEASPTMPPTDALYAASARLHRRISSSHGIRLELGVTVKPHNAIVPTACPGTLDLARILGGTDVTPDEVRAIVAQAFTTAGLDAPTVAFIKDRLKKDAHHTHHLLGSVLKTGEPD